MTNGWLGVLRAKGWEEEGQGGRGGWSVGGDVKGDWPRSGTEIFAFVPTSPAALEICNREFMWGLNAGLPEGGGAGPGKHANSTDGGSDNGQNIS